MNTTAGITPFGKFLRKLRIDNDMSMKEMAYDLHVSVAYLSSVENQIRNIPARWLNLIITKYSLDFLQQEELKKAIENSIKTIKTDLTECTAKQREAALVFYERLKDLDDDKIKQILFILEGKI
jgi:transcriptional regulator with XRE-family HTH domain